MRDPHTPTSDDQAPPPIGGQFVLPGAAVIFTLYYFSTIIDSPWTAQVSAFMIGAFLLVFCAIFFVKSVRKVARGEATLGMVDLVSREDLRSGRVALFAVTLAYILLIKWGGFTLTTFAFLFAAMVILNGGKRKGLAALIAGGMAGAGYLLFILAFDTRFPRGLFETFMQTLLEQGG